MTDGSLFDMNAFGAPPENEAEVPSDSGIAPAGRIASSPKSLYRKYRPQSFEADDLFGQDHVVNTLRNAIALDRIAHAYLFCGPRGTGKTTTARILAKAVNCLDPNPAARPCNSCAACVAINSGATTDIIEIDAASNRGIDDIRDLRERVKYAPSQLKTKFYIIDEAHQITGAAANAFLKTLEEPPDHTKFILATTDPEDLLQTIVSRCQRFDFRRINLEAMVANLTKIAEAENIDIDGDAKVMIARHATGSLRDAQGLLDQVAVYRENVDDDSTRVTVDLVRTVLGVSRNDRVESIASALADRDAAAGVRAIGEAVEAGDDIRQLARQLLTYMRELLLARAGGQSDLDEAGQALAQRFDVVELAELTRKLGDIDFKVKHATISQLPLEIAIVEGALRVNMGIPATQPAAPPAAGAGTPPEHIQWTPPVQQSPPAQAPQTEQPARPRGSLRDKVRGVSTAPATHQEAAQQRPPQSPPQRPPIDEQAQASSRAASRQMPPGEASEEARGPAQHTAGTGGALQIDELRDRWPRICDDVRAINRRIESVLRQTEPVDVTSEHISLVSPYPFHRNRVNTDDVRQMLESVIDRHFGTKSTVRCYAIDEWNEMNRKAPKAAVSAPQQSAPRTSQPAPPTPPEMTSASTPEQPLEEDMSEASAVESVQRSEEPSPSVAVPPETDPAPDVTTDPAPVLDTSRQIEAIRNIFDADEV